ncbi:hypothetical protein [Abyssicoccus albus]|uniref:Uncharacterized protein n=1 Tax=Abyssicoccus albus TaxID=1817405 RepID=A0A3N5C5T0_9BACL|nr:hypothetical protein [Abyssicoccus albus]RPF54772.1 hypothetical protein EDD62_1733 [Abyssicoccus albus]
MFNGKKLDEINERLGLGNEEARLNSRLQGNRLSNIYGELVNLRVGSDDSIKYFEEIVDRLVDINKTLIVIGESLETSEVKVNLSNSYSEEEVEHDDISEESLKDILQAMTIVLGSMNGRLSNLEDNFEELDDEVEDLRNAYDVLEKGLDDNTELLTHKLEKLDELEKKLQRKVKSMESLMLL